MFMASSIRLGVVVSLVVFAISPRSASAQSCAQWQPGPLTGFPEGTDGEVLAMATFDHDGLPSTPPWLVVAGNFENAGGVPAKNIAAWDGQTWHALGSGLDNATSNGQVRALAILNGQLIAGGTFTQSGAVSFTNNVARWDGSA